MPTICVYQGITVAMFYNDHMPPHFHARYADHKVEVTINPVGILAGGLPGPQQRWVLDWAQRRQQDLTNDWNLARNSQPLLPILP